jgi:hypothetical protein
MAQAGLKFLMWQILGKTKPTQERPVWALKLEVPFRYFLCSNSRLDSREPS